MYIQTRRTKDMKKQITITLNDGRVLEANMVGANGFTGSVRDCGKVRYFLDGEEFAKKDLTDGQLDTIKRANKWMRNRQLKQHYADMKNKDRDFFFGEGNWEAVSNKYFNFKRYIDNDNIIILTNNIRFVKGNPVLLVDNNKAVYLKSWQIKPVESWFGEYMLATNAVKLNRNFFKVYTFKSDFDNMAFEQEDTFDSLIEDAKLQDADGYSVKEA